VHKGVFTPVKFSEGRLIASLSNGDKYPHMIRNALVRRYNKQAEPKLIEKTRRYAETVGVEPEKVGIKTYKSRCGTCNSKGHIDYNWRIIMAPHSVIDYVVVHELGHLKHFNHSKNFRHQVERIMPEYREHQAWLKANGKKISF
jgi:predicted metal-dependent hydrolase